jgi:hypothetical protein
MYLHDAPLVKRTYTVAVSASYPISVILDDATGNISTILCVTSDPTIKQSPANERRPYPRRFSDPRLPTSRDLDQTPQAQARVGQLTLD